MPTHHQLLTSSPILSDDIAATPRYSGVISPLTVAEGKYLLVCFGQKAGTSAMT